MNDLTYTATGTFDENSGEMNLMVMIPKEEISNIYKILPQFDMSKKTKDGKEDISCVLCLLKLSLDNGNRLYADAYNFPLSIGISNLISFNGPDRINFDPTSNDALFMLFHDNDLDVSDLSSIYNDVESYFLKAKNGNFNIQLDSENTSLLGRPRTLGLSLILR